MDESKVINWISGDKTLFERVYNENGKVRIDRDKEEVGDTRLPKHFGDLRDELVEEVANLRSLGKKFWTEYRILTVQQLWVKFYKVNRLKSEAQSVLDDLENYADNPRVPYDKRQYENWEDRIRYEIHRLDVKEEEGCSDLDIDRAADKLRSDLVSLYEHVTDYEYTWALGTALFQLLLIATLVTIPALLFSGLLVLWYPEPHGYPNIVSWMLLAPAGALAAGLRLLWRAEKVEVGNEEGSHEVWRAVMAVPLGVVAGLLAYAFVASGVLQGHLIPCVPAAVETCEHNSYWENVSLSILWAMASGFAFEYFYARLKGAFT